jgi:phosphoserine aminotransferase
MAGAQKNCGIAGLTIVIIRDELLGHALPTTPTLMNFKVLADSGSMYNTPPTFSIYTAGLVFDWVQEHGGVGVMERESLRKSKALYEAIEQAQHFRYAIHNDGHMAMTCAHG